jgi:hypothetical protein
MMKISTLLFLFFTFIFCAKAQEPDTLKVIGIHPAVGKIISQDEKIRYHLFPEYKDSAFISARVLKYTDSTFMLSIRSVQGVEVQNHISTKQLDALYYQIDDVEKGKQPREEQYVLTEEEKRQERKRRNKEDASEFWMEFLGQMIAVTVETLIFAALSN